MKKLSLAVASAALALSATLTPAASAQDLGALLNGAGQINQIIDNFDCNTLGQGLRHANLVNQDTTRSQLAGSLKTATNLDQVDPVIALAGNVSADRIADRALACGVVKADPQQDIFAFLQGLSSGLPRF